MRLTILAVLLLALTVSGADINKGYTFLPNDTVTATKLNNLVDAATINTAFFTGKSSLTNLGGTETMLVYDPVSLMFKRATLNTAFLQNNTLISGNSAAASLGTNDWVLLSSGGTSLAKLSVTNLWGDPHWVSWQSESNTVYSNDFVTVWSPSNNALSRVALSNLFYGAWASNAVRAASFGSTSNMVYAATNCWVTNIDASLDCAGSETYTIANPFGAVYPKRVWAYAAIENSSTAPWAVGDRIDVQYISSGGTNTGFSIVPFVTDVPAPTSYIKIGHGPHLQAKRTDTDGWIRLDYSSTAWKLYLVIEQ